VTRESWTIALAGLGRAAREIHLPACSAIPRLRVVGGCDPIPPRDPFPFPVFPALEPMLEATRPDILAVLAPPAEHFVLVRGGLTAGCHVLCEKPFVLSLDEVDKLVALAQRQGLWIVVNNQYRFMDIHLAARRAIGSPEFGELLFLDARQSVEAVPEASAWRNQGRRRTCQEFGTHVLDLCRFLFGVEPLSITARMPRPAEPDGPDLLDLIRLDFPGDRCAQITLDRLCRGPHRYLDMNLSGSAGYMETRLGGKLGLHVGIRGGRSRGPFAELEVAPGGDARLYRGERFRTLAREPLNVFAHATQRLLRGFLKALDEGGTPPCHAADNRRTLALMLAAYDSDERRARVALDASG